MINPGGIPRIPGDMELLAQHAGELSQVGPAFSMTGEQVNSTWQQLAGVYDAPEAGQLMAATGPVQTTAASVGEDIAAVGGALATYASTVKQIQDRLDALRTQAEDLVAEAEADKDSEGVLERAGEIIGIGGDNDEYAERSNELVGQVNAEVAAFEQAQRVCANAINALYGGLQYRANDGDSQEERGEFGDTAEQLNTAFEQGQELPWGSYAETDTGIVGAGRDWVRTTLGDLGSLIGRDPVTGDWSWSTAGTAWQGVGTFALAAAVYSSPIPVGAVLDQKFNDGRLGDTLLNAGQGLIAYDEWGKGDNARAATMAGLNILSAIVGTKGAGATLRGIGTGAQASRVGAFSRFGTAMVRGSEFIGRLPTTESLIARVSQHIPHLRLSGNVPDVNVPHHVDTPHVDTPRVDTPRVESPNPGSVGDNLAGTGRAPDGDISGDRAPDTGTPGDATHDGAPHAGAPHDGLDTGNGPDRDAPTEHHASTDPMPPPEPGNRSLETLAESRIERGPDGLIETVDGRPVREYLHDVAEQRAEQYRGGRDNGEFSRGDIGEVSSVAIDRHTGELFEGTNGRSRDGVALDDLHPLLRERLERLEADGPYSPGDAPGPAGPDSWPYPHPDNPLSHAEVRAVNELLWRRGADIGPEVFREFRVDNYFPFKADGIQSAPACANCSALLADTPSNAGRFTGFPPGPENLLPE